MLNPKFSIITVTYNAGKVLEKTIQSVISQTYDNVEYLIIDGCSKDNTLAIVHQYKENIHQLISEPDKLWINLRKKFIIPILEYIIISAAECLYIQSLLKKLAKRDHHFQLEYFLVRGHTIILFVI